MSPVAIAAKTKATPHMASAGMLRCCSHDSSSNPPATAKVNPVIMSEVGRSKTFLLVGVRAEDCDPMRSAQLFPWRTR